MPEQECLVYTDGAEDEQYCADTCAPGRCGDEEACSLEEVQCVRAPCPPVAVCTAIPFPSPSPPTTIAGYEGCFKDTRADRVLGHQYDSPSMTTDVRQRDRDLLTLFGDTPKVATMRHQAVVSVMSIDYKYSGVIRKF